MSRGWFTNSQNKSDKPFVIWFLLVAAFHIGVLALLGYAFDLNGRTASIITWLLTAGFVVVLHVCTNLDI